jgi:Uma2 family endonuclease
MSNAVAVRAYVDEGSKGNGAAGILFPLVLPRLLDNDLFFEFCQKNPDLRIERNANGDVRLMTPSDSETDYYNTQITTDLNIWNRQQGEPGYVFGPSAGFTLPNGAVRSPDASWIAPERYEAIPQEERRRFPVVCPDFVVELMSPSDSLVEAQSKMEEYQANGALLGWLIDRENRRVYIYRPNQEPVETENPATVSADPEIPGFSLSTGRIF